MYYCIHVYIPVCNRNLIISHLPIWICLLEPYNVCPIIAPLIGNQRIDHVIEPEARCFCVFFAADTMHSIIKFRY